MHRFDLFLHLVALTARNEHAEMGISNKSIRDVPERGFVYQTAKTLSSAGNPLFGHYFVQWQLERDLGNGGPSDLVLYPADRKPIVVEFKMDRKDSELLSDVEKLRSLDPNQYERLFVAILAPYADELPEPPRVTKIESAIGGTDGRLVKNFPSFPIEHGVGAAQLHCLVCGWRL